MTHSRDSISTQDSIEVLFSSLSLVSRHSSRIGYELYLADLPGTLWYRSLLLLVEEKGTMTSRSKNTIITYYYYHRY